MQVPDHPHPAAFRSAKMAVHVKEGIAAHVEVGSRDNDVNEVDT